MNVGIDLDDCLIEMAPYILDQSNRILDTNFDTFNLTIKDILRWKKIEAHDPQCALDIIRHSLIQFCVPVSNVVRIANQIKPYFYIISYRPEYLLYHTRNMLESSGFEDFRLILSYETTTNNIPNKAYYINLFGLDIFIDDKIETIIHCYHNTNCKYLLYFKRPWRCDMTWKSDNRITQVESWNEIEKFLEEKEVI